MRNKKSGHAIVRTSFSDRKDDSIVKKASMV